MRRTGRTSRGQIKRGRPGAWKRYLQQSSGWSLGLGRKAPREKVSRPPVPLPSDSVPGKIQSPYNKSFANEISAQERERGVSRLRSQTCFSAGSLKVSVLGGVCELLASASDGSDQEW